MTTKTIHLQWEGPFAFSEVKRFTDENIDYGIYQIYGLHPVYGQNTLLYIGKTSQQTFAKRMPRAYWTDWESNEGHLKVYIGRLAGSSTPSDKEWDRQIKLAEVLLITAHKPAQNASGIGDLSELNDKAARDVHVLNWGDYGVLLPEISGARWGSTFDEPLNYDFYGKH